MQRLHCLDAVKQRRSLGAGREQRCSPRTLPLEPRQQRTVAGALRYKSDEPRRVADLEVALIVGAQHSDVTRHPRSQHGGASCHGFDHDIGAAFHAGGHQQKVRTLDGPTRPRMRAWSEPLHARIDGG